MRRELKSICIALAVLVAAVIALLLAAAQWPQMPHTAI